MVGIEICEDLWVPVPPSSLQAMAGATILLNLSASNETIGKSRYRTDLVVGQSGRAIAAYAMAGCGPSESTTDVVFGGHCLIAENGRLLAESPRVGDGQPIRRDSYTITQDVDVAKLHTDRRVTTSFDDGSSFVKPFRRVPFALAETMDGLKREVPGTPFVPPEGPELHRRCAEIFGIQCAGLAKRIEQLPAGHAAQSRHLRRPRFHARAPGRGHDLRHARPRPPADPRPDDARLRHHPADPDQRAGPDGAPGRLRRDDRHQRAGTSGISGNRPRPVRDRLPRPGRRSRSAPRWRACPAKPATTSLSKTCRPGLRTFLLMSKGFVVGTGDLSELALGWSTYNGDHMSMYNPNCSIPKTLVKFLVRYVAPQPVSGRSRCGKPCCRSSRRRSRRSCLPAGAAGEIEQSTEATLGPYELHDFILYHAVRCGYSPAKILFLSRVRHLHAALSARADRADDADVLQPVLPPAVQAVVRPRRPQGRHGQPLAPRRLADALRRRPGRVAEVGASLGRGQ